MYEGEWAADKRHGRGKFIYADGDKFEGDFVEDQQHGEGRRAEPRTAPSPEPEPESEPEPEREP